MRSLLLLGLVGACTIGDAQYPKPRDLPASWLVDRLRVLAIQAEPPEIAPGDTATFSALLVDPDLEVAFVIWLACPPGDGGDLGCNLDLEGLDPSTVTPEQLAEMGVIGIEPFFAPTWTAPADLLDGMGPQEAVNGLQVSVQLAAIPQEAVDSQDFDFNQVEVAYKRIIVSTEPDPNRNPTIDGFTVDGVPVAPDEVAVVTPGEVHELAPVVPDEAAQSYRWTNGSGEVEDRVEELYASWYATGGDQDEDVTLAPYWPADWIAPAASGVTGTWWVVVRDRRGGMTWTSRSWRTE